MNTYTNDTTEELLRIITLMATDKNALLRDGFQDAADQNQQVIDACIAELQARAKFQG
jgi:hypothetical protein